MTKKLLFLSTTLLLFFTSCTKNLEGIQDFKNWKLEWNPNFGLAILNADISYNDLKNIIPEDSNFTVTEGAGGILVIHANQKILSALNDFFILQNFSYSPTNSLPIGGSSPQSVTFQIPLTQLINVKGVKGTIQSIKFADGIINLKLQGNGVQNINSISASLGGVSSGIISPTNNNEVIVPINLKDQIITITGDNIELGITMDPISGTFPLQASLSLASENLDLTAITINNFSYASNTIETSLSMNFFDKINNGKPFTLDFKEAVNLSISFNNESNLKVSLSNFKATYFYKDGSTEVDNITAITGNNNQTERFPIKNLSNLLTKVTFSTGATITANNNPITLSKTANVELKGSVDIPLDVNIQGVNYETNIDLPKITDDQILNALENLTIKTSSNNGFPVELSCVLRILDEAGNKIDSLDLGNIVKGENTNITNSFDKNRIQQLVSTGKGQVVLGIATHNINGQPDAGKFTIKDKLSLRLGLSIKANGKELLNSL